MLAFVGRELAIGLPVSTGTAWFMSMLLHQPFFTTLVYSLCIGFCIQTLIRAGQYGLAYRLRKRLPDHPAVRNNWPGWGVMAPWILVSASVGYLAGHALGNLLTGVRGNATGLQDSRALVVVMAVVFAVSIACVYFMYARSRMATMEAAAQATMRSTAENQLKMLQSQLEPHMLFNTLANLRVLIGLDPSRAQAMLDHIIAFLRATLEASRAGSHPLSVEFARIGDYLEMMQVRMGSRLHFELDLPAALSSLMIPPLLLQPLVENAIKHGLEPKIAGGSIVVRARREGDILILSVRDTGDGPGLPTETGTHFGLQHVSERIATVYGKTAALDMREAGDADGGTLVQVRIPATYPSFATDEARR